MDLCFIDGNQYSHPRFDGISVLEKLFKEPQYLQPAANPPLWGRSQQSIDEGGACCGFLIAASVLTKSAIHCHGTFDTPPEWRSFFREQDTGWHRGQYLQLNSLLVPQGTRNRSDAAAQRRKDKWTEKQEQRKMASQQSSWQAWSQWSGQWQEKQGHWTEADMAHGQKWPRTSWTSWTAWQDSVHWRLLQSSRRGRSAAFAADQMHDQAQNCLSTSAAASASTSSTGLGKDTEWRSQKWSTGILDIVGRMAGVTYRGHIQRGQLSSQASRFRGRQ